MQHIQHERDYATNINVSQLWLKAKINMHAVKIKGFIRKEYLFIIRKPY